MYDEIKARSAREYVQPSMLVSIAAAVGEKDAAIAYAQQALEVKDPLFVMLARMWPDYETIRDDPRFERIVKKLAYPD